MKLNIRTKYEDNRILLQKSNQVPYLSFPILTDTNMVIHGFSTRFGGVSKGWYSTMNLAFTNGDDQRSVMENYRRMSAALGVDLETMVLSAQTHGTNIRAVTMEDAGKGILRECDYNEIDGLITNVAGITLVTSYADCVPLYFIDPVQKAIGLSHSGWRGTVNHIGAATIEAMSENYGSKAEDIKVVIGPSICKDCYEVSLDVADQFKAVFSEREIEGFLLEKADKKYQLDLWKANELVLLKSGILPENYVVSGVCTCENGKQLYSHRATKGKRGNLAAFLALTK